MTLEEFLAKLSETPRTWTLTYNRAIRSVCDCPLIVVAGKGDSSWLTAAMRLHLHDKDVSAILCASDDTTTSRDFNPALRAKLLTACGLSSDGSIS